MRSSMDVDVPLACKLDVIAGPCSGRAYTNTEDVLEVGCVGWASLARPWMGAWGPFFLTHRRGSIQVCVHRWEPAGLAARCPAPHRATVSPPCIPQIIIGRNATAHMQLNDGEVSGQHVAVRWSSVDKCWKVSGRALGTSYLFWAMQCCFALERCGQVPEGGLAHRCAPALWRGRQLLQCAGVRSAHAGRWGLGGNIAWVRLPSFTGAF